MRSTQHHSVSPARRRAIAVVAVLGALAALTACSADGGDSGGGGDANLTVALTADVRSLAPSSSTVQQEINVSEQITEKLVEFSVDATEIEPRLATSWTQVDDVTLELDLRTGVEFTNGEAFDAESAVYSINEVTLTAPPYSSFVSMIDHAEVVDENTIRVVAKGPTGLLLNALAMGSFQYPAEYFAEVGLEGFGAAPIGTGPFVLDKWTKGDSISMTANPDYWGGAPAINSLTFRVIPDKSAQIAALQSGQIDLMNDVPVGSINTIRDGDGVTLATRPSNRIFMLDLSELTDTPLADPAVRRALWYAIDTESLIENQLGGLGTPLNGQILVPTYFGYAEGGETTEYDPEKARELLADAGYPDGFSVTFKYSSGRYTQDTELGQAIADQLSSVGITVTQEPLESGTFLTQLTTLELNDMFLFGTLPPPDAHFMYQQFLTGSTYSYYSNTEVDELLAKEASSADQDERAAVFAQITDIFREDPPFVPLFQGEDTYGVSTRVDGFTPRASQFLDITSISVK